MGNSPGYFLLAHPASRVCHDPRLLTEYKARLKHALLFNEKIIIADYMIVNSPNFRLAYHNDDTFRQMFQPDLVEIAHFEKFIDGRHFTLSELRDFYRRHETKGLSLFSSGLAPEFRRPDYDSELEILQNSVTQQFPESAARDPLFTQYVKEAMHEEFLKDEFGPLYSSYETAFELMKNDVEASSYPIMGIIHFESHDPSNQRTIFDYMADIPRVRAEGLSKNQLVKRFGHNVRLAHRTLLIRAETELVRSRAVLPNDFRAYRRLILPASAPNAIEGPGSDEVRFPIDVSSLTHDLIASLSLEEIRQCRKLGEFYFHTIKTMDAETLSLSAIGQTVKTYAASINAFVAKRRGETKRNRKRGFARVVYRPLSNDIGRQAGTGLLIQLAAYEVTTAYNVFAGAIVASALGAAAKAFDPKIKSFAVRSADHRKRISVESEIIKVGNVGSLTQYE